MWQWVRKFLGRRRPVPPVPGWASPSTTDPQGPGAPPAAPARNATPGTGSVRSRDGAQASGAPESTLNEGLPADHSGHRRPLLDKEGRLAGFEHCLPGREDAGRLHPRSLEAGGETVSGEQASWIVGAMALTTATRRRALAVLPSHVLDRPAILDQIRPGMMLALSDGPFTQPARQELLSGLRKRGAILGSVDVPRGGASFVVFDATGLERQALLDRARACRMAAPGAGVVATGIRTLDDLEAALHGGFEMAAGLFDRAAVRHEGGALAPDIQHICSLIRRVMSEGDTAELAREIRADVGLAYRLLQHANSPLLGLSRQVDSVDHALQLLGRQSLYRWLTMLLLVGGEGRPTSMALREITLARARMMEQLAPAVGAPPPVLFTTGLLSLLDVMMQVPMAQALAPLKLPAEARAALIDGTGPWRPLIELARSLEAGQTIEAERLAADLGGSVRVNQVMHEAWAWAAEAARSLRPN